MTCQQFIAGYTEYLDSEQPDELRDRFEVHLARCPSCARYDRVLRQGLRLVQEVPELPPSPDFELRLQHGIFHLRDERTRRPRVSPTSGAALLAVAGLVALAAWGPLSPSGGVIDSGQPTLASPAAELPAVGGTDVWFVGAPPVYIDPDAPPSISLAFPGPYSPLVVEPPLRSAPGVHFMSLRLE
jgi:anti-sigma factor RsiW